MELKFKVVLIFIFCLSACGRSHQKASNDDVTQYVDPFIGTGNDAHVFPGASLPFGMVQLSPDQNRGGWGYVAGYNYANDTIAGFSHTHFEGTGVGDLLDISFLPTTRPVEPGPRKPYNYFIRHFSRYSHDQEGAEPGYYWVKLLDTNIKVELTATIRAGF